VIAKISHYAGTFSRDNCAFGLPGYKPRLSEWFPAARINFRRCVGLFGGPENTEAKTDTDCSLNRCTCFGVVRVDELRVFAVVRSAIGDATVNESHLKHNQRNVELSIVDTSLALRGRFQSVTPSLHTTSLHRMATKFPQTDTLVSYLALPQVPLALKPGAPSIWQRWRAGDW
jgi:hypothetical protein